MRREQFIMYHSIIFIISFFRDSDIASASGWPEAVLATPGLAGSGLARTPTKTNGLRREAGGTLIVTREIKIAEMTFSDPSKNTDLWPRELKNLLKNNAE